MTPCGCFKHYIQWIDICFCLPVWFYWSQWLVVWPGAARFPSVMLESRSSKPECACGPIPEPLYQSSDTQKHMFRLPEFHKYNLTQSKIKWKQERNQILTKTCKHEQKKSKRCERNGIKTKKYKANKNKQRWKKLNQINIDKIEQKLNNMSQEQ